MEKVTSEVSQLELMVLWKREDSSVIVDNEEIKGELQANWN